MLKSKKGTEIIADLPWFIAFVFILGITSSVFYVVIFQRISEAAEIQEDVEELILASRFYSSENCFAYEDEAGKVHDKTIDLSKFNQEQMIKCFPKSNVAYAFSLSLEIPGFDIDPIRTFNWVGTYATKEIIEIVKVMDGNKEIPSTDLRIKIKNVK